MATVSVRYTFTPLTRLELITAQDMRDVGNKARQLIIARTQRGFDESGAAFEPYSDGYAKQRREAGLPTGRVTLTASGEMLNNISVISATNRSVTLGWVR